MKKKILFSICFSLTCILSSCSNEDILQNAGVSSLDKSSVVSFSCCSNGQKGLTRSGATVTSLTTFNVWSSTADGNDYIGTLGDGGSGEAFTYDALAEVFKSDVNHYWPSVGTLNFFASNVFTQMDGYYSDQTPHDAVVEYTNDGSKDIVCATVRTGTKTIPYPLLFHHVLSQVKVTAEAKDKTQDLQYRVVGITMTTQDDGVYHYATSTAGIGTWELNDEESTRAYAFGANMPAVFEKDGRFASTDYWNVLPCVNDIVFSIQYQVIQNGVVISDFTGANAKTVTVSSPGLLSEKKYTYNFKLGIDNDDVITLDPGISDWDDEDPIDLDVPLDLSFSLIPKTMLFTTLKTTQDLTATVAPSTASQDVTYLTTNRNIADVDTEGSVISYADGTCRVVAKSVLDPTLTDTCTVTVSSQRTYKMSSCHDINVQDGEDNCTLFYDISPMIELYNTSYYPWSTGWPHQDKIVMVIRVNGVEKTLTSSRGYYKYYNNYHLMRFDTRSFLSGIYSEKSGIHVYSNPVTNKSEITLEMALDDYAEFTICPVSLKVIAGGDAY